MTVLRATHCCVVRHTQRARGGRDHREAIVLDGRARSRRAEVVEEDELMKQKREGKRLMPRLEGVLGLGLSITIFVV